ncbi:MAG: GNAT family N-acetyltransferase [Bacteroidota bacterium]
MDQAKLNFQTERLQLIPFRAGDTDLFHQLNTDPFVRKYMWDDEVIPREVAEEVIQKNEIHFKEDSYGLWKIALKENNTIIGYTGLWYFFEEPQPQLIYALLEVFTGQGFAREAAQVIVDYSFQGGFDYLIAATDPPNIPSQKVAESLGMRLIEKRLENDKPTLFYRIDKP